MCVGVTKTTINTDRNVKIYRDMKTGNFCNNTPPLLLSSCKACYIISYIPNPFLQVKFFCQPFSALLCPLLHRLCQFSLFIFYYQVTDLLGLKHSPASIASYTPILTAQRRFTKAYIVPLLASSSSIASLSYTLGPPKKQPRFLV